MLKEIIGYIRECCCDHKHKDGSSAWILKAQGQESGLLDGTHHYFLYVCTKCLHRKKIKT
jgi:hypothetical protein